MSTRHAQTRKLDTHNTKIWLKKYFVLNGWFCFIILKFKLIKEEKKRMLFFANFYKSSHRVDSMCWAERGGIVPFCEKVCPRLRDFRLSWLDKSSPPFLSLPFLSALRVATRVGLPWPQTKLKKWRRGEAANRRRRTTKQQQPTTTIRLRTLFKTKIPDNGICTAKELQSSSRPLHGLNLLASF